MRPHDLMTRSNARGALALGRDWAGIVLLVAVGVWANHWVVYLGCVCAIGALQYAIAEGLLHEAAHYNLFRTRRLNNWLQVLFAWPFFIDFELYRAAHFTHHRDLLGEGDSIPDLYYTAGYQGTKRGMWWLWWVRPVLGYGAITFIYANFPRTWRGAVRHGLVLAALLGGAWWLNGLDILLMYWFVPLLTSCAVHYHWVGLAEHLHTKKGPSRTTVSPLWNLIHHDQGYHHIHHQYAAIPWFNLKRAHDTFNDGNTDISTGLLDTFFQVSNPEGAIALRPPSAQPTGLLRHVMAVLNWRPGARDT